MEHLTLLVGKEFVALAPIRHFGSLKSLYQEALGIFRKVRGEDHRDTATSLNDLAELYVGMGEYAKAEALLQEALRIDQKDLGNRYS